MPNQKPYTSTDQLQLHNSAVLKIQSAWCRKTYLSRIRKMNDTAKNDRYLLDELLLEDEDNEPEYIPPQHDINNSTDKVTKSWNPPDIQKALRFADFNHPRKGGELGGNRFDFFGTTLGRHCLLSGVGEQLDVWDEGKWSDFSTFGPGNNY